MASFDLERKIKVRSSDLHEFEISEEVAKQYVTIKYMIEVGCADDNISLPNVSGKILPKVIEYAKRHVDVKKAMTDDNKVVTQDELKAFDASFVKVDHATLFDLILAANVLEVKALLDITCQAFVDKIMGKTPEEIRKMFNLNNDLNYEEEEVVRRENPWAFE